MLPSEQDKQKCIVRLEIAVYVKQLYQLIHFKTILWLYSSSISQIVE